MDYISDSQLGKDFIFIFIGNSLWELNCKLDKNYKNKIVRRKRIDKFNKPSHSDITSTCEI